MQISFKTNKSPKEQNSPHATMVHKPVHFINMGLIHALVGIKIEAIYEITTAQIYQTTMVYAKRHH